MWIITGFRGQWVEKIWEPLYYIRSPRKLMWKTMLLIASNRAACYKGSEDCPILCPSFVLRIIAAIRHHQEIQRQLLRSDLHYELSDFLHMFCKNFPVCLYCWDHRFQYSFGFHGIFWISMIRSKNLIKNIKDVNSLL